ncbi:MAG: hypothetical protein AAFX93_18880 [Verrucomicrobiota bacterium]
MKIADSIKFVTLSLLISAPLGAFAAASGENTAAHVKAYATEFEGENHSLDVVFIRFHRHAPENVPYTFFWAMTIDEDARAGGGAILVVADGDDRDKLIRRYGTNLDRDGRDGPDHNSMRGTVRMVQRENGRQAVYLDITEEGVDLSNAPKDLLDDNGENFDGDFGAPVSGGVSAVRRPGPPPGR